MVRINDDNSISCNNVNISHSNKPLVTCIIPVYNNAEFLSNAVNSIANQTYDNIELIITDDGSDSFSLELYNASIPKDIFKRAEIIRSNVNTGTVENMNRGLRQARGDIIMPLACDDSFASEEVVNKVVTRFLRTGASIVSCRRLLVDVDGNTPIRLIPSSYDINASKSRLEPYDTYLDLGLWRFCNRASGSCTYYLREFIKNRGYYDNSYVIWEDGPFYAQVSRDGIKIEYAFDIVSIKYRNNGISKDDGYSKAGKILQQDMIRFYEREYLKYPSLFNVLQNRTIQVEYRLRKERRGFKIKDIFYAFPGGVYNSYIRINRRVRSLRGMSKEDNKIINKYRSDGSTSLRE